MSRSIIKKKNFYYTLTLKFSAKVSPHIDTAWHVVSNTIMQADNGNARLKRKTIFPRVSVRLRKIADTRLSRKLVLLKTNRAPWP